MAGDDDFVDLGDDEPQPNGTGKDWGPADGTGPRLDDDPAADEARGMPKDYHRPAESGNGYDDTYTGYDPADIDIEPEPTNIVSLADAPLARRQRGNSMPTVVDGSIDLITPDMWYGAEPPDRRWVVEGWLPAGHVSGLYAAGGTGKTLVAQQLMTCIAAGRQFLGLPTTHGPVVGIFCEDDADELWRRQKAICEGMALDLRDLGDRMTLIPRIGYDNSLMVFPDGVGDPGTVTPLWEELRQTLELIAPALVIVDTIADTFSGNENDRLQPRRFVQACLGRWCRELDTTVLGLAHPSRTGMSDKTFQSGSTAWEGAMRSRWSMSRPDVDDDRDDYDQQRRERVLRIEKSNYAPAGDSIKLVFELGHLRRTDQPLTGLEKRVEQRRQEKLVVDEMERLIRQGQVFSAAISSPAYYGKALPRLSELIRKDHALSRKTVEGIVNGLLRRGVIGIDFATQQSPRQRLFFKDAEAEKEPGLL